MSLSRIFFMFLTSIRRVQHPLPHLSRPLDIFATSISPSNIDFPIHHLCTTGFPALHSSPPILVCSNPKLFFSHPQTIYELPTVTLKTFLFFLKTFRFLVDDSLPSMLWPGASRCATRSASSPFSPSLLSAGSGFLDTYPTWRMAHLGRLSAHRLPALGPPVPPAAVSTPGRPN
ncbi:hypothetical protein MSAN_00482400 [Mycena sanguinolenta]|uniref:Uncharacterized protein n=1 Tax=Mycena sanguinolenta TaxID=230812 RepID=A0A8H6Z560_9AGAR|nr:hypothetical protein MSAN_00482400 [Mycena sanguinolenta]